MTKLNFLIFLVIFMLAGCGGQKLIRQVCIKNVCVATEIADTEEKRQKGLMFREKLGEKQGMLFIFEKEAKYSFWMKNMKIPLDMIWINEKNLVVDITIGIKPCVNYYCGSVFPNEISKYVLEVNAGFVGRHNIKTGDRVVFK